MSSGITTSWPANQSDAKLLEGGVFAFDDALVRRYYWRAFALDNGWIFLQIMTNV